MKDNSLTSREMYNLIIKLEKEGMSSDKIIEIIKFIEENRLSEEQLKKNNPQSNHD